ncbi:ABC transporter ATP-binding protein [Nocardia donostiensis]|uniref:ABC transporter ATP-binding protein n=1 Tax=Nocardia donostiensis TaxID=1538463 RepID=A0A1W0B2R8_9NOCA|nr:ABC transporter ATP-binding protein [Nocardia donostiensis]ONM48654.1 ABC transporter ATP-binding protein [Nocardia donostiensis]OQS16843.1 ABC transporter ATP-binding protein [Nocardia donostiensis]OQS23308.1 ABC transporter ATP-binding protein [Nocardia donostiensis]
MTLAAQLHLTRGNFRLTADLVCEPGEVLALLGPNGAGKTTALRALAGLTPLTDGSIRLDGQVWDGPPNVFVPAERRPIGVVFQDYLLFAHLTALDNVAFGLRARGHRRAAARAAARRWLDRVGVTDYAHAKPRALSGGQAQRVALARALATAPQLLLLDEPLSALDASTRLRVRSDLAHHLADFPGHTVLVTHDPLDALVLADRLVIIENGAIVQQGSPAEVARRPRSDYVANLVGLNLFRGTAHDTTVDLTDGGTLTTAEPATGPVHIAFPPTAIGLHLERPTGSPRNTWPVTVAGIEQHAHTVRVRLDGTPPVLADVTPATVADLRLRPGLPLWAALEATEVHTYPA